MGRHARVLRIPFNRVWILCNGDHRTARFDENSVGNIVSYHVTNIDPLYTFDCVSILLSRLLPHHSPLITFEGLVIHRNERQTGLCTTSTIPCAVVRTPSTSSRYTYKRRGQRHVCQQERQSAIDRRFLGSGARHRNRHHVARSRTETRATSWTSEYQYEWAEL